MSNLVLFVIYVRHREKVFFCPASNRMHHMHLLNIALHLPIMLFALDVSEDCSARVNMLRLGCTAPLGGAEAFHTGRG